MDEGIDGGIYRWRDRFSYIYVMSEYTTDYSTFLQIYAFTYLRIQAIHSMIHSLVLT